MDTAKFLCKFEEEEEDLRRTTKINEFVTRYTTLLSDTSSEEYVFWKTHVAPSCVPGKYESIFVCVFCGRQISTASGIRRHYMEQHYAYIPEGIFGAKVIIECKQCDISFARQHHLASHMTSELHLKNVRLLEAQNLRNERGSFFANSLIVEDSPKAKESANSTERTKAAGLLNAPKNLLDSGYWSLNSTLAFLDHKLTEEQATSPLMTRSSTRMSALVGTYQNESSHLNEVTHEAAVLKTVEEESVNCKGSRVYESIKNKSFPVYLSQKKQRKTLDKADLSDAFFQNLSFNE